MNISHKLKLIWFAPARTASRALHALLEQYDFVNLVEGETADLRVHPHTHECKVPSGLEHYNILLQIRNPYSRVVSLWHLDNYNRFRDPSVTTGKRCDTLEEFIYTSLLLQHRVNRFDELPVAEPKYIISHENFAKDVLKLDFIDFTSKDIAKIYNEKIASNTFLYEREVSSTKPLNANYAYWQTHYTQELADIVYKASENYFKKFGYKKDSWKIT